MITIQDCGLEEVYQDVRPCFVIVGFEVAETLANLSGLVVAAESGQHQRAMCLSWPSYYIGAMLSTWLVDSDSRLSRLPMTSRNPFWDVIF